MKIYSGEELYNAIIRGEIKEGSTFVDDLNNEYEFKQGHLVIVKPKIFAGLMPKNELLVETTFILKNDDEINIKEIEKLETGYSESGAETDIIKFINEKVLTAVKQLDNRLKQLEELNIEIDEAELNKIFDMARNKISEDYKKKNQSSITYCENCGVKLTEKNKYNDGMCMECKCGIDWENAEENWRKNFEEEK